MTTEEQLKFVTNTGERLLTELRQLRRENERLRAVAEAARILQGACSRSGMTEGHSCKCDECQAWFSVNAALKALEAPHEG